MDASTILFGVGVYLAWYMGYPPVCCSVGQCAGGLSLGCTEEESWTWLVPHSRSCPCFILRGVSSISPSPASGKQGAAPWHACSWRALTGTPPHYAFTSSLLQVRSVGSLPGGGQGAHPGFVCICVSRFPRSKVAGTEPEKPGLAKWGFLFPPSFLFLFS